MFDSVYFHDDVDVTWMDEAECSNYDPALWSFIDGPSLEVRSLNKRNFETAEKICARCPVFTRCWETATDSDKFITMRAGAWPEAWSEVGPGRPRLTVCRNGHDLTATDSRNKKGQCVECLDVKRAKRREERQKKSNEGKPWGNKERCRRGHDKTLPNSTYVHDGRVDCRVCRLEYAKDRRAKKKAAKMEAAAKETS